MPGEGVVIKLGGSVLTEKSGSGLDFEERMMRRLAAELAEVTVRPLVLVHGAGSFGHQIVARTGIDRGLSGPESLVAFGETQRLQHVLTAQVAAILLEAKLPVMPVQASATAVLAAGRLEHMDLDALRLLIQCGMVPLLSGVPAVDCERGASILSGDVIAAHLASRLDLPLVVHATDTDGVFDRDPHRHPEARRIARIDRTNWAEVRPLLGGSTAVDVTGGMLAKVEALLGLALEGRAGRIVSARIPGRIQAALDGQDVGTLVTWEAS
jgi:isopentenyl phosphate kinase